MPEKEEPLYDLAQRRLIGSLIADGSDSTMVRILDILDEQDVEEPKMKAFFLAMSEIARRNEKVSEISVVHELEKAGALAAVGGLVGVHELASEGKDYILDAQPELYAFLVKDSAAKTGLRKTMLEYGKKFMQDSGQSASDAISDLQSELNERLVKLSDSSTVTRFDEVADDYMALLDERRTITEENAEVSDGLQGIPCLLPSMNYYTGGWKPGQMVTVAARTGVGKSAFAIDCALAAAKANKTVLFFSLEMERNELLDRLLSASTMVPQKALQAGTVSDEEKELVRVELATQMKLIIDTEPNLTVDSIRARAIQQAQTTAGLDFIIIDYLQLITSTARTSNRQEAIANISRSVKKLAKQLGVPIMVLAQLNRADKDEDPDALPKLDQIRESAAIAQDSDIVILLHRKETDDGIDGPTIVILDKNRGGQSHKKIFCTTNLACALFLEKPRASDVDEGGNGFDEEEPEVEVGLDDDIEPVVADDDDPFTATDMDSEDPFGDKFFDMTGDF